MKRTKFAQPAPDMVGLEVNGAVVIADAGTRYANPTKFWRLRCACGEVFEKAGTHIRNRPESVRCRSCANRKCGEVNKTHGETGTAEHNAWMGMRRRCYDTANSRYGRYGERGIRVCTEWRDSYPAFAQYVRANLGPKPTPQHSLDRIDNDGHYEPGNIRWATRQQQRLNSERPETYKKRSR